MRDQFLSNPCDSWGSPIYEYNLKIWRLALMTWWGKNTLKPREQEVCKKKMELCPFFSPHCLFGNTVHPKFNLYCVFSKKHKQWIIWWKIAQVKMQCCIKRDSAKVSLSVLHLIFICCGFLSPASSSISPWWQLLNRFLCFSIFQEVMQNWVSTQHERWF